MSKLDDILEAQEAYYSMGHWGYGSVPMLSTKAAKQEVVDLFLELTNPEYEQAFNAGNTETYEMWVRVRQRVNEL